MHFLLCDTPFEDFDRRLLTVIMEKQAFEAFHPINKKWTTTVADSGH